MLISNYGFWERRNVIALVLACARRGRHIIDVVTLSQPMLFLTLVCYKFTFLVLFLFQGADIFAAKINIEVQRATEGAIAAIERNGGVITTSFYDPISLGN